MGATKRQMEELGQDTKNNNSIYKKLLEVKNQIPYLKKDAQSQYSYASPTQVLGHLNPLLNGVGILLKSEVLEVETERITYKTKYGEKTETLFVINMRMTWVDVETGETDVNLWASSGANDQEKGYGSALTYGERYFMLKYFNIPTDNDDPDKFIREYIKNPLPKDFKKMFLNASDLEQLKVLWDSLTAAEKTECKPLKEQRKKEILNFKKQ